MREIRFRAWFKDNQEMKSVAMNNLYMGNKSSWMHLSPQPMSDYRLVEIMQYTGLKDKNGVEIYEGDITNDHIGVGVVEYNHSGYRVNYNNGQCKWFFDYLVSEYRTIEVIGNVYSTPELLEVR